MGRDKKNKPKKPKKYLNHKPTESFAKVLSFTASQIDIPYNRKGDVHGREAEQAVFSILERSNIPNGLVLNAAFDDTPNGEIEISDGIILYGDTAFLMQIKSRNKPREEAANIDTEVKKIERLVSEAYKQAKSSLDHIRNKGHVTFTDQKTLK